MFTRRYGDRPGVPNLVIVLTDGQTYDVYETAQQASLVSRAAAVSPYSLCIVHRNINIFLERLLMQGSDLYLQRRCTDSVICMYLYVFVYIRMYLYVFVCIHMYFYVFVCICPSTPLVCHILSIIDRNVFLVN